MYKGFAWNRKYILLGTKLSACVVSVFSDTSSVCVALILALADNIKPMWYLLVDHHTGTCGTNS